MINLKKVVDIACGIMFAVSAMAAVGPVTTLQGTCYCVLVMAVTGAWLWCRGILVDTPKPMDGKVHTGTQILEKDVTKTTMATMGCIGSYPKVNDYVEELKKQQKRKGRKSRVAAESAVKSKKRIETNQQVKSV